MWANFHLTQVDFPFIKEPSIVPKWEEFDLSLSFFKELSSWIIVAYAGSLCPISLCGLYLDPFHWLEIRLAPGSLYLLDLSFYLRFHLIDLSFHMIDLVINMFLDNVGNGIDFSFPFFFFFIYINKFQDIKVSFFLVLFFHKWNLGDQRLQIIEL